VPWPYTFPPGFRVTQRLASCIAASVVLLLAGCRDLSYAQPDGGGAGPSITVISPRPNDTIRLSQTVALEVEDANGVQRVALLCETLPVATWASAPFTATVDFSPCRNLGTPASGATRAMELVVMAEDRLGSTSEARVPILLDTSTPDVRVSLPERVAPGGELLIRVTSNQPLETVPIIRVGTQFADPVSQSADLRDFTERIPRMPDLGIDSYDGGSELVPIEVLDDIERLIPVTVDARPTVANPAHLETVVLLSRVLWERPIPGVYDPKDSWDPSSRPAASARGLQLPLMVSADGGWLPDFLSAADGSHSPFRATGLLAGGYSVRAVDGQGRILLTRPGRTVEHLFLEADTHAPLRADAGTYDVNTLGFPMHRVGDFLCQERISGSSTCPPPTATHGMNCASAAGDLRTQDSSNASDYSGNQLPGIAVPAGDSFLAVNYAQSCGGGYTTFSGNPAGTMSVRVPINSPFGAYKVLPLLNGNYAITHGLPNVSGAPYPVTIMLPASGSPSSYFPPEALAVFGITGSFVGLPPSFIVMGRTDQSLVTLRLEAPDTVLEAWLPGATTPEARVRLPGMYEIYPRGSVSTFPTNTALSQTTGRAALVLRRPSSSGAFGFLVVVFDANFRPAWIYRPPRLTNELELVADWKSSHLYVIDVTNQYVTALMR
jgi:hypothetical protein